MSYTFNDNKPLFLLAPETMEFSMQNYEKCHISLKLKAPQLIITDRSKAVVLMWSLLAVLVSEFR